MQVPQHVAIVMDGNGRWAQERGQQRVFGHKKGGEAVRTVVTAARKIGIKYLTLYAFSTENWLRPKNEVQSLMKLLLRFLGTEVRDMIKNDIRLNVIGDLSRLSAKAQLGVIDAMEKTRGGNGLLLSLAISYGGREEILRSVRGIVAADRREAVDLEKLDEDFFAQTLCTTGLPEPDLLIRTGREKRLSNFLLWQCAYTELYFTDVLWPDFGEDDFREAIEDYQRRKRRFGGVGDN